MDHFMKVTILGSGTVSLDAERNASGLIVKTNAALILVDMGPGTLLRLAEAGFTANSLDIVIITHFHPDHVSDLVPFLFATNYAGWPDRDYPVRIIGPRGLKQLFEKLVSAYGKWIVPSDGLVNMDELDPTLPDNVIYEQYQVAVKSTPAVHTFPSLSVRIEAEGKSVTISGDTDYSTGLIDLANGSHTLICECSFPEGLKKEGHLIPSEAGDIAEQAGVSRLVLTHFYPPCHEVDVVGQAADRFSGEIFKAEDFMEIIV
jgi:ribonuclease BN (tRNA processing enzyme)